MKDRQTSNLLILTILSDYLKKYPDIRFSQALLNLNIVKTTNYSATGDGDMENPIIAWADEYNLEPEQVLSRMFKNT